MVRDIALIIIAVFLYNAYEQVAGIHKELAAARQIMGQMNKP